MISELRGYFVFQEWFHAVRLASELYLYPSASPQRHLYFSASVPKSVLVHTMSSDKTEVIWGAFMSKQTPAGPGLLPGMLTQMTFTTFQSLLKHVSFPRETQRQ